MRFWMIPGGGALQGEIRFGTLDEEPVVSVLDVLREVCQIKPRNVHKIWQRLKKTYPFDTENVRSMKFPGPGQRDTPVANREEIIRLMMLPPQKAAATHRAQIANLVERALSGDPVLIEDLQVRQAIVEGRKPEKRKKLPRSPERERCMTITKQLQGVLNEFTEGKRNPNVFRDVFRPNMVTVFGMEPHTMVDTYGIDRRTVRDILTPQQNTTMGFLEMMQTEALRQARSRGGTGPACAISVCSQVRQDFTEANQLVLRQALPMKTYEVYMGVRARTEGSDYVEEIPHQGGVIASTTNLREISGIARILFDYAKSLMDCVEEGV